MSRRELPLLANRLMVPEIVSGAKDVTRRVVVPEPHWLVNGFSQVESGKNKGAWLAEIHQDGQEDETMSVLRCPFGQPGDLLWVREEHKVRWEAGRGEFFATYRNGACIAFSAGNGDVPDETANKLLARKTRNTDRFVQGRYMPKALARLWLLNMGVRVERLQDITDDEALREGVEQLSGYFSPTYRHYQDDGSRMHVALSPRFSFRTLMMHLHGPEIWDQNPWVWVVDFYCVSRVGRPTERRAIHFFNLLSKQALEADRSSAHYKELCVRMEAVKNLAKDLRKEAAEKSPKPALT